MPLLHCRLLLATEQHLSALLATRLENCNGLWLGKARQLHEIAVGAKRKLDVTIALAHWHGRHNGNTARFHLLHQ
jgi:hypothetical protein